MSVRDYVLTFAGASEQELQSAGKFLRVLEAPTDAVYLTMHGQGGSASELKRTAGQEVHLPDGFKKVIVRSAVAQTVRIAISETAQNDTSQQVTVSGTFSETPSTAVAKQPVVTVPAAGSALLVAGNANRDCVRLAIASSEPGGVYIGETGIAAGEGGLLEPGQGDYVPTTAALYAFNPGASDVDVSVLELNTP